MRDCIKRETGSVRSGRAAKRHAALRRGRQRGFSESFLFTLGLAFIIVYFTGVLFASRGAEVPAADDPGAVAVFAEYGGEEPASEATGESSNLWDEFTAALSGAFGRSVDG